MSKPNSLDCPFCGEQGFDDIGLKHHLLAGHCDVFNEVGPANAAPTRKGKPDREFDE